MMPSDKMIYGVTGGSGAGKSHVSRLFLPYGAHIIDVDKLGHIALENRAKSEVIHRFGPSILSPRGHIDRKKLGRIVFNNTTALNDLNKIVHGYMVNHAHLLVLEKIKDTATPIIVIDAALLFKLNLHLLCDKVILVTANMKTRIARITHRDGISKDQALNRITSQEDYTKFFPLSDIIVTNNWS